MLLWPKRIWISKGTQLTTSHLLQGKHLWQIPHRAISSGAEDSSPCLFSGASIVQTKKARILWESNASFLAWNHFRQQRHEDIGRRTADNDSGKMRQQGRKLPPLDLGSFFILPHTWMQGTPEISVTGGILKHFGAALLSHWDAADSKCSAQHSHSPTPFPLCPFGEH